MKIIVRTLPAYIFIFSVWGAYFGLSWLSALNSLLTVGVLCIAAYSVQTSGWRLLWTLFYLYDGSFLGMIIDLHLRPPMSSVAGEEIPMFMALSFFAFAACGLLVLFASKVRKPASIAITKPRPVQKWVWKSLGLLVFSLGVYFLVGMIATYLSVPIRPKTEVQTYLVNHLWRNFSITLLAQFIHGLLCLLSAYPLIHDLASCQTRAAIVLGLCFAILGSSEYFFAFHPHRSSLDPVFYGMILERLSASFLLGLGAGYLLVPPLSISSPSDAATPS